MIILGTLMMLSFGLFILWAFMDLSGKLVEEHRRAALAEETFERRMLSDHIRYLESRPVSEWPDEVLEAIGKAVEEFDEDEYEEELAVAELKSDMEEFGVEGLADGRAS